MKLLVTGATGFIGRHLMARLSVCQEIIAVVRNPGERTFGPPVSVVAMDLTQELDPRKLPGQVDVIIHLAQANLPFPEAARHLFTVNTAATAQLLDYGRRAGAQQFVLASSGDVYGHRYGACREGDVAAPASFYAVTKYASELLVQAYSHYVRPCILRLFHPYGPGQTDRLVPTLADRIRRGEAISLHQCDRPYTTPTYVEDVVRAFESAIRSSFSGVLNVAGGTVVSMRDLSEEIGAVLRCRPVFAKSGMESADAVGDNTRMKDALGIANLVGLTDGLRLTLRPSERGRW
jgi:nucleoside-diphosphate-sugar epimerase